jgi:hypothetical protein
MEMHKVITVFSFPLRISIRAVTLTDNSVVNVSQGVLQLGDLRKASEMVFTREKYRKTRKLAHAGL